MRWLRSWRFRFNSLFRRSQAEADLHDELQDYLAHQTERHLARGLLPEQARLAALREAGGMEQIKEECREARGTAWLEQTLRDIRYALRSFRRSPGFVLTVAGTIALGLGLNTALFTAFNAYVLRPLSIHDPYSLYRFTWTNRSGQEHAFSWPEYQDLEKSHHAFSEVAAVESLYTRLDGHPVQGQLVTGNYFQMLGVGAALGRTLLPEDATVPGRDPVIVLSHAIWRNRFGSQSDIIGRKITLRGYPMQVVGIARQGFQGLGESPQDFWVPLTMASHLQEGPDLFGAEHPEQLMVIGRVKKSLGVSGTQADLAVWSHRITAALPTDRQAVNIILRSNATIIPLTPELLLVFSPLAVAFGLVLLLACTNVTNMMLARALTRQREIGIRLSLGAARARLIRQLLTESILLSIPAAILGFAIAQLTIRAALRVMFATVPPDLLELLHPMPLPVDGRVFGFMMMAALLSALLFGLAPALQATRGNVMLAARVESLSMDLRPTRLRNALVVTQITVCTLLLIACGALVRTTIAMSHVDLGFQTHGVIAMHLLDGERARVLQTLATDPEVEAIVAASSIPLGGLVPSVTISGQNDVTIKSAYNDISSNYFDVLHIPMIRGRHFAPTEAGLESSVAILSAAAAQRLFPKTNPLGQVVHLTGKRAGSVQVIGIAEDVVTCCIAYGKDAALLYLPTLPSTAQRSLLVRVRGEVEANRRRLDAELRTRAPGAVDDIHSLDQYHTMGLYPFRAASFIGLAVGVVALLLTVSGVYGVLSYLVMQRTKEMGIRMALGATPRAVTGLIWKQSLGLAALGLSLGVPFAFTLSRFLASQMLFLRVFDMATFGAGVLLVLTAALLAGYIPSRKAARVDPMETLRYD
jgi:predicted permease